MKSGITSIILATKYHDKLQMLQSLSAGYNDQVVLTRVAKVGVPVTSVDLGEIDRAIRTSGTITFDMAFGGMLLVVAATNNILRRTLFEGMSFEEAVSRGTYFLTAMAMKECFVGLNAEEVAGLVAAGMVDVVYFPEALEITETSGMGADRGWGEDKTLKTINASTLSSFVMASLGFLSMKHGSYGNTTKVGSTNVLEEFGANIIQLRSSEVQKLLNGVGFWFSDAHSVKTLHYLSHLLKVETINHVVGPMTPPIGPETRLYKLMGVNHNVHPSVIARAYAKLHERGLVNLGGVVVVGGVTSKPTSAELEDGEWFRRYCHLDEVSPYGTLVSLATGRDYLGTYYLEPSAFGVELEMGEIVVANEVGPLMQANREAMRQGPLAKYLACNSALALLTHGLDGWNGFGDLKSNVGRAYEAILAGRPREVLEQYVYASRASLV